MRRIFLALFSVGVATTVFSASSPDSVLRDLSVTARTNVPAALLICDKAVAEFPTNAEPLSARARVLDTLGRYAEAIRDLTAALKLEPKSATLWQGRGEVNFKAGNFKESVADFDRVLELAPDRAANHWQRGISLYYAGRFSDGRKQFELHQTVNPNDIENAVWHFLCVAREEGMTNARASMIAAGRDARIPMPEIYTLYRGQGTVEQVLAAAVPGLSRDGPFYAHLYLGLYFAVAGDTAKAREHMSKAAADSTATHYMGDVARVHLRLLERSAKP